MFDRLTHIHPLRRGLFAGNNDVYIVAATKAVIRYREQTIGVGRKIDPHNFGLLVNHMIDETGVLVAKAVMILPPDVGGEQIVERSDRPAPGNVVTYFEPFGMLIEHRVNDVNECFIAGEKTVAPGQQIALQPTLALMLAEHFHDPAIGGQVIVVGIAVRHPSAVGHF